MKKMDNGQWTIDNERLRQRRKKLSKIYNKI